MKRKIISIGRTALAVTLPSKWYQKHNLKRGDAVIVSENGMDLVIQQDGSEKPFNKTAIDISGLDTRVLVWVLSSLHKKGFDEIKITYGNEKEVDAVKEILNSLFTGFAIIDQTDSYLLIRSIMHETAEEFHNLFRRAFRVTITMGENCLDLIKKNKCSDLPKLLDLEHTNNQLVNFCQRIINKGIISDNSSFYYVLLWNLEKVCDDYKYICTELKGNRSKISEDVIEKCSYVIAYLDEYYNLFYQFEMKKLLDLNNKRLTRLRDLVSISNGRLSGAERVLAGHFINNLGRITDFSTSMIAIRHNPL